MMNCCRLPASTEIIYGNGLNNIKARSQAAGWRVQWISELDNGTEVVITSTIN